MDYTFSEVISSFYTHISCRYTLSLTYIISIFLIKKYEIKIVKDMVYKNIQRRDDQNLETRKFTEWRKREKLLPIQLMKLE